MCQKHSDTTNWIIQIIQIIPVIQIIVIIHIGQLQ